jgi:protein SCO1/2
VTRAHIVLATVVACTFGALVGLYAARHDDTPAKTAYEGAVRPPGIPPPRFDLTDQDGRRVSAAGLRGRAAIVSFLYTHCQDTCPLVADQIRGALDHLGRRAVPVVAVSVDPAGDTRASARAFLLKHDLNGRARFLLGTEAQLAPVWRQFGVAPQRPGTSERDSHTTSTVLLDARGVQRIGFRADDLTPEALAHDVRTLSS